MKSTIIHTGASAIQDQPPADPVTSEMTNHRQVCESGDLVCVVAVALLTGFARVATRMSVLRDQQPTLEFGHLCACVFVCSLSGVGEGSICIIAPFQNKKAIFVTKFRRVFAKHVLTLQQKHNINLRFYLYNCVL